MIIQRYIFRELTQKLLWIMGLLILILAGSRFAGFLAAAAEGSLPGDLVFMLLGYKMLASLSKILPVSILAAMLLAFARMSGDRELVILSAAGVGRWFQIRIILRFTLLFCLLAAGVTLYLAPWAERGLHQLKQEARQRADIAGIQPGRFKEFSQGDRVVYVQNPAPEQGAMERIFVQIRELGQIGILTAASARFEIDPTSGHKYIVFSDGQRYLGQPGRLNYQITEYERYALLIDIAGAAPTAGRAAGRPTLALIGSSNLLDQAELQWRLSLIIACLLLPLLAFLLLQPPFGERRYLPFILGISIFLIYSNLLGIAQTLLERGLLPALIGLWWVHLLLALLLAVLYALPRLCRNKHTNAEARFIPAGRGP